MRSPRRIFRSQTVAHARLSRPLLLVGAALSLAGLAATGLSSDLFGRTTQAPERVSAAAPGVAVVDGGTLRLGGQVVRLRGVNAPSRGGLCQGGRDCGGQAASALAGLVRDRRVDCRLMGRDRQDRPMASCEAGGVDLSRAVVASGWARAGSEAPELADVELHARRQGNGLWAGGSE